MPADIVTTEQLRYQLAFIHRMDMSTRGWLQRFSWFPKMQECHYTRIDQIYLESRQQYGDKHFERYGLRRRLSKKFMPTDEDMGRSSKRPRSLELELGLAQGPKVPPTENGEYGRVKPTAIHFC
ncbi:uncharacterized protein Dana_GF11537 [Drosophila ananassae]|uniref:Uncharacterized protein n=1 Tax=Drosophila ananassae TaxID=7217 RepID=B3MC32_DROAN|nr:uncharacterized protein LOC6494401 [Drosophila ananassae]EDV37219.1 uncharacterized protein Dana_GF11537 [Drosophila ananassae]